MRGCRPADHFVARVQKLQQTVMVSSLATIVEEAAEVTHVLGLKEQGKVLRQNIAVMQDARREEVMPSSVGAVSRAAPLYSVQGVELPRVEVPFSPLSARG